MFSQAVGIRDGSMREKFDLQSRCFPELHQGQIDAVHGRAGVDTEDRARFFGQNFFQHAVMIRNAGMSGNDGDNTAKCFIGDASSNITGPSKKKN